MAFERQAMRLVIDHHLFVERHGRQLGIGLLAQFRRIGGGKERKLHRRQAAHFPAGLTPPLPHRSQRVGIGEVRTLVSRHEGGAVVLATLKDGYYLVLSMGPQSLVGGAVRQCEEARHQLNQEL